MAMKTRQQTKELLLGKLGDGFNSARLEREVWNLRGADLSGANLRGADLSGADLTRAKLNVADLTGADLSMADLSGAYLTRADLSMADLRGAKLNGADLRGAKLNGADLSGAYLYDTKFADGIPRNPRTLLDAKGLDNASWSDKNLQWLLAALALGYKPTSEEE